ncbi:MAG TPA: hypothetical protein EYP43_00905, partial [Thermoplasmata archaeon]|nr:hypothetical protein [Thermoplasmata archaeon]
MELSNVSTYATTLTGANDPIGEGLSLDISLNGPGNGARNQDHPDNLTVRDADVVFLYDGADVGGTRYIGSTYNVVFFSFGFEGINDAEARQTIAKRLMLYYQGGLVGYVNTLKDSKVYYIRDATVTLLGTPYTAITNEKGYYFFSGIAPGEYTIRVRAEGFEDPKDKTVTVHRGDVTEVSDFVLQIKPAQFRGVVTDQNDQAIGDAGLLFVGRGSLEGINYTDTTGFDGRYEIDVAEGTYDLRISKVGYWDETIEGVSAWEGGSATWVNVTIYRMRHPGNVTGIIDYEETPLEGIRVVFLDNLSVETDEDGRIPVTMLPAGNYTVKIKVVEGTAAYELGLKSNTTHIEIVEGETTWINMTLEAGAVGSVHGTVTDNTQNRNPIEGAEIELVNRDTGTPLGKKGITDKDGYYSVTKVPVGDYYIRASAYGYTTQQKVVKIVQDEDRTVNFVLPPGEEEIGYLLVRVNTTSGLPLAGVWVTLVEENETHMIVVDKTNTYAQYNFGSLQVGTYTIRVHGNGILERAIGGIEIRRDQSTVVDVAVTVISPVASGTVRDIDGSPIAG